jgi:two-component system sensor histidine kinase ResE
MTTTATLLQFAAEVSLFLVAVAGIVLAARAGLVGRDRATRSLLVGGFVVVAVAAFAQGTLTVDRVDDQAPLLVLRLSGAALLALGALGWSARRSSRVLLGAGLAALVVAALADRSGATTAADLALLASAASIGGSIVVAGRRSIPVRIGTSAAALLLLVVLAVSLAVSVVLTRNVEDEALQRYGSRTRVEADAAANTARGALVTARVIGAALTGGDRAGDLLAFRGDATAARRAQARTFIGADLAALTGDRLLGFDDPVVFVAPDGEPEVASPTGLGDLTRVALAADDVVVDAQQAQGPRQGVSIVGNQAYGVAAVPLLVQPSGRAPRPAGVLAVAVHLDDTYLRVRETGGEPLSFSLVAPATVLASSGPQPAEEDLLAAAQRSVTAPGRSAHIVDGRFVVATPVGSAVERGAPAEFAFVTSVPTTVVDDARDALFRTLFIVVLAAALVSVGGAALMGERIGGGLRRLIRATEQIRAGDLDARAHVRRDDELGVLGASFDEMAGSLRTMTGELRVAAADEARLRSRLEAVFAGMGEALVACDCDRAVTECNRVAAELLGVDPDSVRGRPLDDVVRFSPTDSLDPASVVAPEGGVVGYDGRLWTASGLVPVHVTAGPLYGDDDRVTGAVFVLRDVRPERQAEQAKADLLATIGHELRTPLTPIKGYADMIRRQGVDPAQAARFAEEISGGVDRLERVVGQLVNFATVSGGPIDLELGPVKVEELVQGALERAQAAGGHDRVWRHQVTQGPIQVVVDRHRLDQAFDELVDNAVKYSAPGSEITIGADVAVTSPNGNGNANGHATANGGGGSGPWLRMRVTDAGEGLDTARLAQLAGGFSQGDGSATRRHGGLGLGLALADRIARAHGGALTCRSSVGTGATFTIVVPAEAPTNGRGHP